MQFLSNQSKLTSNKKQLILSYRYWQLPDYLVDTKMFLSLSEDMNCYLFNFNYFFVASKGKKIQKNNKNS